MVWGATEEARWKELTGSHWATRKGLCDLARRILAQETP
jgi:hypothetical protein